MVLATSFKKYMKMLLLSLINKLLWASKEASLKFNQTDDDPIEYLDYRSLKNSCHYSFAVNVFM